MHDFLKEGWLTKSGPKQSDGYRKRWFSLDRRRLMYHESKLVSAHFFLPFLGLTNHLVSADGARHDLFC